MKTIYHVIFWASNKQPTRFIRRDQQYPDIREKIVLFTRAHSPLQLIPWNTDFRWDTF